MQVATVNYQHNPQNNFHSKSLSKFHHRQIFTTVKNPTKKPKQRRSGVTDVSLNSNTSLPAVKRPSSIRVKGSGVTSTSKFNDVSTTSFHSPSRSHSRQSDKSDIQGTRSRSNTPTSKLVRVKFGYPVKIRSSDFYNSNLTESELRFREESFVNDSIRSANHSSRSSVIPHYESLNDPNLTTFFKSPLVSDVIRKTLNIDLDTRSSQTKKHHKSTRTNNHLGDYHRIVAKHSSGYAKLNGYDCIPPYAPARQRLSTIHSRYQTSANSSLQSAPTYNSFHIQQKKKPTLLKPIATSSPTRYPTEASSDNAANSSVSQD